MAAPEVAAVAMATPARRGHGGASGRHGEGRGERSARAEGGERSWRGEGREGT